MLFNSYEFLFALLPVALAGYYILRHETARLVLLTLLSYLFYGWWDFRFCGLMLFSTTFDYVAGLVIGRATTPGKRKAWLVGSVIVNLSLLGFFKYFDLFARTMNAAAGAVSPSLAGLIPILNVVLPVGISFYTFQSMSYTIDVYRRVVEPQRSFLNFAFFVSFFPQLVAGPIVRYRDLADQLVARTHTWEKAALGITFFVLGLGKKVILADAVAPMVSAMFDLSQPGFVSAWAGMLAYSAQIYFDFSGYSDMAVGLGLLFGFKFPQNFNSPYQAESITDFWRRWHMSLSTWLRDYLYVPLGGNRLGERRTYVNLFLTMLLGGLWHGAAWTFVLWGAYHGILLAIERLLGKRGFYAALPRAARQAITFLLVMIGWIWFRSADLGQAKGILAGMAGLQGWGLGLWHAREDLIFGWIFLPVCMAAAWFLPNTWHVRWPNRIWFAVVLLLLFGVCVMTLLINTSSPFLYFQF